MKNNISKYMMIAAAAAALFAAVELQAAPAPGGGGGDTSTPTSVVEQAVPAKTAVTILFSCTTSTTTCTTSYAVPIGMRLVIETINGRVYSSTASFDPTLVIQPTLDGVQFRSLNFFPTRYIMDANAHRYFFELQTKIYTDSVGQLGTGIVPYSSTNSYIQFIGYLVKK